MKKSFLLGLFLLVSIGSLFAQRTLEKKEKTEALSIFVDKDPAIDNAGGGQAGAIISCPITLNLSFSSNVDRTVDVYKTEERGDVRFYFLRLIVGRYRGASYDNRTLEVIAPGFAPLKFKLELQASESKSFEIFDPNATVGVGCFYQHYNEGVELFKKAMYPETLEKYRVAMECTDMPEDVDMKQKIRDIDTILVLRKEGDKFYDLLYYKEAMNCYQKIVSFNIDDQYAQNRAKEAGNKFIDVCKNYFDGAEVYYANGNYSEARKMYEMVVLTSCPKATEAGVRLSEIGKIEYDHNKRIHAILYEFSKQTPIGISVGSYKEKKFAGYFSLSINPKIFKLIQKGETDDDYKKADGAELNVSAGWTTMKLPIPLWGFFGLGYSGVSMWDFREGFRQENGNPTLYIRSAVSPEIGLLGKVGRVALRYTFQYRFAFNKADQDEIGQFRHVIGAGICF